MIWEKSRTFFDRHRKTKMNQFSAYLTRHRQVTQTSTLLQYRSKESLLR